MLYPVVKNIHTMFSTLNIMISGLYTPNQPRQGKQHLILPASTICTILRRLLQSQDNRSSPHLETRPSVEAHIT